MFIKRSLLAITAPALLAVFLAGTGPVPTAQARDSGGHAEVMRAKAPAKKKTLKERGADRRAKKEAAKAKKKKAKADRAKAKKIKRYTKQLDDRQKRLTRLEKHLDKLNKERVTKKWTKNSDVRRHLREVKDTKRSIKSLRRNIKVTKANLAKTR